MKRDPFAPIDVGDIVQLSHDRVGAVEKVVHDTAFIRLVFGERLPTDVVATSNIESPWIAVHRFLLIKFIRPESADA